MGQFFYDMYNNAIPSEDLFDENNNLREDADELVNNPNSNGFIRIRYHWSEDPSKDEKWYQDQCRELNFNTRSINQELDLIFVGSTNCIFEDEYLAQLKPKKPVDRVDLPHAVDCKLYTKRDNLDKTDFLLIGVDTAKSITGDYSAIEIFTYSDFEQVGEFYARLGSISKYCDIIKRLVDVLEVTMHNRLILCIENNSIGAAVIESLENDDIGKYVSYIYSPFPNKYIGINTNAKIKNTMVSFFYDDVTKNPSLLKSEALINQLNIIERQSNGAIRAKTGSHDDLFMASCLCAYTRHLSELEYLPLIGINSHIQQQRTVSNFKQAVSLSSISKNKSGIQISYNPEEHGIEYNISDIEYTDNSGEDPVLVF